MYFPINSKAEGRVLVPWEQKEDPLLGVGNSSGMYNRRCPFCIDTYLTLALRHSRQAGE